MAEADVDAATGPSDAQEFLALERQSPAHARGEYIPLPAEGGRLRVGRAEESEIRLYSASASRAHAVLQWTTEGWRLERLGAPEISIDDDPMDAASVVLERGMNLAFGEDVLRCVRGDPAVTAPARDGAVVPEVSGGSGAALRRVAPRIGGGAVLLAAAGLLLRWLLGA